MRHLREFTAACIEALYFTDTGEEGQPSSDADIDTETEARLRADCHSFWARCWYYVENTDKTPADAGHDFWLTRNGHGAGFWEWPHTPYADQLTNLAECYGAFETYEGDDGKIHA